jgi:transposase-like protein
VRELEVDGENTWLSAAIDTEFLVDAGGYLTALARHDLSGHLDYHDRNHIEKWFQTVAMRIDRFHSFWRGSQPSARR